MASLFGRASRCAPAGTSESAVSRAARKARLRVPGMTAGRAAGRRGSGGPCPAAAGRRGRTARGGPAPVSQPLQVFEQRLLLLRLEGRAELMAAAAVARVAVGAVRGAEDEGRVR